MKLHQEIRYLIEIIKRTVYLCRNKEPARLNNGKIVFSYCWVFRFTNCRLEVANCIEKLSSSIRFTPKQKFNTNCFVSQTYFVASELRRTVICKFVLDGPGVVIVVCSPGYRSSNIVVCNFASIVVICIVKISFLWI